MASHTRRQQQRHQDYSTSDEEDNKPNLGHHEDDEDSSNDDSGEENKPRDYLTCPPFSRRRRRPQTSWLSPSFKDPKAKWIQEWNRMFLLVCAAGLFIDPLFFYALSINDRCMCVFVDGWFGITVSVLRCMTDALHLWNMWLQFRLGNRKLKIGGDHSDEDGEEMSGESGSGRHRSKTNRGVLFDIFVVLPLPQMQRLQSPQAIGDGRPQYLCSVVFFKRRSSRRAGDFALIVLRR